MDVRKMEKIFAIINIDNVHWTLGMINTVSSEIKYYDSLAAGDADAKPYLEALRIWIDQELLVKYKFRKNDSWQLINVGRVGPQQTNGSDCGIYALIQAHNHKHTTSYP
jgi:Ulp1 family protease